MKLTSDMINEMLNDIDLPTLLKGKDVDISNLSEEDKKKVFIAALCCILNGPVGVAKQATFPLIGTYCIKDTLKCTNRTWSQFCAEVVILMPPEVKNDSWLYKAVNAVWPEPDAIKHLESLQAKKI